MAYTPAEIVDSAYALTIVSFLIIISRTLLRRIKHEKLQPDDYLMLFSMLLYAMNTAVYPVEFRNGINITQNNPQSLTDRQLRHVILGSKLVLIGRPFYMSYIWAMKTCILIYYTRLTARTKELNCVKIVFGLVAITWVLNVCVIFTGCRPIQLFWQVLPAVPNCARAVDWVIVMGSTNIFTDILIMAIPLPIIFRAKLQLLSIIRISALFLVGFFTITISMVRIFIVLGGLTAQNNLFWGQLDCFASTIVANAPILHSLMRHSWNEDCTRTSLRRLPTYLFSSQQDSVFLDDSERDPEPQAIPTTEKSIAAGKRLRKSIRELSDLLRGIEHFRIHKSVEISREINYSTAEELKTRQIQDMDLFLGAGEQHTAQITSRAYSEPLPNRGVGITINTGRSIL